MRVLVSVLVGQQGEEALAGLLGNAPWPGEAVGRRRRRGVAVWRWRPRRQERRVGLLSDNLQTQVLLMGEGCRVVQHHGSIVLFTAAHTATNSTAAAAAAASCHAPWKTQAGIIVTALTTHFGKKLCFCLYGDMWWWFQRSAQAISALTSQYFQLT